MNSRTHLPSPRTIETPSRRLKPVSSGVTLWRPDIVLADSAPSVQRRVVMPGEPALRPEAVRAQVEAVHSLLRSLSGAGVARGLSAARAEARGQHATSDRERVSAAMETYRTKAALDEMLQGTLRQVTALMEGRSVR
jgi:hypothetical protein